MKKIISPKQIVLLAAGIALGLGATYALAWTAPTVAPTGGNVAAPINTNAIAQSKTGTFGTQGLLNAGNKITTTGIGLAGMITGRSVRATQNGGFEIVGQPTGWMAAQQYCLTANPATGLPGDPGYNCITSATGWGSSLAAGTQVGQTLSWGYPTAGAWAANNALKVTGDVSYPDAVTTPGVIVSQGNVNMNAPALQVDGKVRIQGGNPAPGKVLTVETGSVSGVGTWQSLGSQITMVESYAAQGGGARRRHFVSCGPNKQVIGGGGGCTTNLGVASSMTQSIPVDTSDPFISTPSNNTGYPSPLQPANQGNGWMIACIDSANIYVWALCIPE